MKTATDRKQSTQGTRLGLAQRAKAVVVEKPQYVLVPGIFVIVILAWEFSVNYFNVPEYVLPTPTQVFTSLTEQVTTPQFRTNLWVTGQEIVLGFVGGVGAAMILGLLISQVPVLEKALLPYVIAFQTVPKVALAPLFIVWFGFGISSKAFIGATIAFFTMLINVIEGLKAVDQDQVDMMRQLRASGFQVFWKLQLPNAMPFIFAGLDMAAIFAVIGAVIGEFVGAQAGLGYQLLIFNFQFDIAGVFAILLVLSAIGYGGHLLIRAAQRRFASWTVE